MQENEFTTEQNSESKENRETVNDAPETVTAPNLSASAESTEQETFVFSQPADTYASAPVNSATPMQAEDEELFGKYEIKSWDFTPRIYKIFAFSAIFNILFLVAVAQTDVLRTKACDSPLVGGFCQVLDTLYVGGKILGTDSEFVDKPFERTELENSEIVWLDQTGIEPPLNYPAGYFQIANPEDFVTPVDNTFNPDTSGFPSVVSPAAPMPNPTTANPVMPNPSINNGGVFNRKQRLPKNNSKAIPNDLPAGINIPAQDDKTADTKKPDTKDTTADNKTKDESVKTNPKSEPVTDIELNRQPLIEHGKYVSGLLNANKVDLATPFVVQAKGKLNKEGKLDKDSFKIVQAQSADQDMIDVIVRSIAAINDSGYLQYIKEMSGKDLSLLLKQDDQLVSATVETEMETEMRARSIKSNLDLAISLVKLKKTSDNMDENDKDDLALLEGASVERQGKKIIIKFDVKKEIAQPMLERKLKISRDAPQTKPNSTAQTVKENVKTGK